MSREKEVLKFLAESQAPRATFWSTTMSIQAAAMIASPLLNIASKGMDRLPDFPKFFGWRRGKRKVRGKGNEVIGAVKAEGSQAAVGGQAEQKLKDLLESILERLRKAGIATSASFDMKLEGDGTVSANSEDLEFAQNVEPGCRITRKLSRNFRRLWRATAKSR